MIIDKLERNFNYLSDSGIIEWENNIVFNDENKIKFYDDRTGNLIKTYDLNDFQVGLKLDIMKLDTHYILGRYEGNINVIDLITGKVTRILDLIPEVDQEFVLESDRFMSTGGIKLAWETDTALIFKYYSITEEIEKTVTCKLGY